MNQNYLTLLKAKSEEEQECLICLEEYKIADKLKVLPCLHRYHEHCIADWLSRSSSCPFCKYEL